MTKAELSEDADDRLADALERGAHGAVVSVPSLLPNGFSAAAYGLFVVAHAAVLCGSASTRSSDSSSAR